MVEDLVKAGLPVLQALPDRVSVAVLEAPLQADLAVVVVVPVERALVERLPTGPVMVALAWPVTSQAPRSSTVAVVAERQKTTPPLQPTLALGG